VVNGFCSYSNGASPNPNQQGSLAPEQYSIGLLQTGLLHWSNPDQSSSLSDSKLTPDLGWVHSGVRYSINNPNKRA
ncbi:12319_t:CDS:1, partial [Ambispora leptoticha]